MAFQGPFQNGFTILWPRRIRMSRSQTVIHRKHTAHRAIREPARNPFMRFNITGHETAPMNINEARPVRLVCAVRHIKTARHRSFPVSYIEIFRALHTGTRRIKLICDAPKTLLEHINLIGIKFELFELLLKLRRLVIIRRCLVFFSLFQTLDKFFNH